jgi:DNA ligase 1
VQLEQLVDTSRRVAEASRRLDKIALLAECLRALPVEQVEIGTGFLGGETRQGRIGVGPSALRRAFEVEASPRALLSLADVDAALERLAKTAGAGSAAARAGQLAELFARATAPEREFLARLVLGELRQGALEGILIEAVARAAELPATDVRRARMLAGNLRSVARAALAEGASGLARFALHPFTPLVPMLANPADDVEQALELFGEAAFEYKLDGARIQLHKVGSEVQIYTRGLNDVTPALPEVVELARDLPSHELVLDGEVLALRADGRPHTFQTTMRRFGRKLDVAKLRDELPLRPYFFDVLYIDGQPLIDRPTRERIAALEQALPAEARIPRIVTASAETADAFVDEALARGHEGAMAKSLDAAYAAGSRGREWLKLKPAHTLDLVVLAAEWGHGRREGWLSNLHLGARTAVAGEYAMIGKTFKGMTDELLTWQTRELQARALGSEGHVVHVRPELVVEIALSDVQRSPHYASGVALRFARVRRYRPDKRPEDADTIETVRALQR